MTSFNQQPETVVIGSGPGGYPAAIRLAQFGKEVTLIEKEAIGGVCLNWGCIPTKTLYSTTEPLEYYESWQNKGINVQQPTIELDELCQFKNKVVNRLTNGVKQLLKANGVTIINGEAKLESGPKVPVWKDGDQISTLRPNNVILASGSKPLTPFDLDPKIKPFVWNSREILNLDTVPDRLTILGGGVIGLEFATIFNRLGSEIQVLEMADSILPQLDLNTRILSLLREKLQDQGITIHTDSKVAELNMGSSSLETTVKNEQSSETYDSDYALLAMGRRPNTDLLTDSVELNFTENGYVKVSNSMKTNNSSIYAVGDLAGPPLLAHKATKEGLIAAADIAGGETNQPSVTPETIFTDPELAKVGLSKAAAENRGYQVQLGSFPYRASGKAIAMDKTDGLAQLIVDADSDQLLGCQILGEGASDMISELTLAIESELTATDLAETVHPHPTLPEVLMEAAENAHGRAINTTNQ